MKLLVLLLFLPSLARAAAQDDYAAWAGNHSAAQGRWTAVVEAEVRANGLPLSNPIDAGRFCPAYVLLHTDERVRFWVALISAIAREESSFDPGSQKQEPTILASGKHEVSYGLLQLSPESASQKAYRCGTMTAELLADPGTNLRCGTKQIAYQVQKTGTITSETKTWTGAGKIFSTLWPDKQLGKVSAIIGFTKGLPFCRASTR